MDTYTQDEARERLNELVRSALEDRRHSRITSDEGSVVLLPEETYHNLAVTLELLSTPGLMDSINLDMEAEAQEAVS